MHLIFINYYIYCNSIFEMKIILEDRRRCLRSHPHAYPEGLKPDRVALIVVIYRTAQHTKVPGFGPRQLYACVALVEGQ